MSDITTQLGNHKDKCDSEKFRVVSFQKEDGEVEFFIMCEKCYDLVHKIHQRGIEMKKYEVVDENIYDITAVNVYSEGKFVPGVSMMVRWG